MTDACCTLTNEIGSLLVAVQAQLGLSLPHLVSVSSGECEVLGVCSLSRLLWLCCGSSKESPSHLAAGAGRADGVKTAKIIHPRAGASKVTKLMRKMWQVVNETAA